MKCRSIRPRGVKNVKYIWYLTINGQMRSHLKKIRFDLDLRESRSQQPKFRSGSEGHLGGSYGPYKLEITQLTKKRAMIFKIVDGRTTDASPMQSLTVRWLWQKVRQKGAAESVKARCSLSGHFTDVHFQSQCAEEIIKGELYHWLYCRM